MTSGLPEIAKSATNRNVPGSKGFSAIAPIKGSVAIDPVEDIGVAFSFDDFKPDSLIVDKDGMPGKPFFPAGSVRGSHSHFMILPFWLVAKAHRTALSGIVQIKL
jgi:hypothetical protein